MNVDHMDLQGKTAPQDIAVSIALLEQLSDSNDRMRELFADSTHNNGAESVEIAFRTKRALGCDLPLGRGGNSKDEECAFYTHNSTIIRQIEQCAKLGAGDVSFESTLRFPEGRHAAFPKIINETMCCLRVSGWGDEDVHHVFGLVTQLDKPKGGRDKLIQRFAHLLFNPPAERPLEEESILSVYKNLLGGNAPFIVEFFEEEGISGDAVASIRNFSARLQSEHSLHPIIGAIWAFQMILILRPFPVANVMMGRVLFSWIASRAGYPFLALTPIANFVETSRLADFCRCRKNNRNEELIYERNGIADWTLWFEHALGFLVNDLKSFAVLLNDLRLKRDRVSHLLDIDKSFNTRQKAIVLEAILHEDAEFTYASIMQQFGVAYATAYSDLGELESMRFLDATTKGKTTVFVASDDLEKRFRNHLRDAEPKAYWEYYDADGVLNESYRQMRDAQASKLMESILPSEASFSPQYPKHMPLRRAMLFDSESFDWKAVAWAESDSPGSQKPAARQS